MNEVSAACRQALEALLAGGGTPSPAELQTLATLPTDALEEALRALASEHGAAAMPLLTAPAWPSAASVGPPSARCIV